MSRPARRDGLLKRSQPRTAWNQDVLGRTCKGLAACTGEPLLVIDIRRELLFAEPSLRGMQSRVDESGYEFVVV